MIYSFNHVSTITGCDALITQAQRESSNYSSIRTNILNATNSRQTRMTIAQEDLAAVEAQIVVLEPQVSALLVGSKERLDKEKILFDLMSERSSLQSELLEGNRDRQLSIAKYEAMITVIAEY